MSTHPQSQRRLHAKGFYDEFPRKGGTASRATHYCAGCGHGLLHKLIAEAMHDFGLQDRAILISPVGCAVFGYYYFDCGNVQAAHGRAPAVGAALARCLPEAVVLSYQGDGDLGSIGLNQTLQAANRGERMAVFFVNNAVYGMTGGQMAPTTLAGQKTVTTPNGRDVETTGHPLHLCELINTLPAPVYIERCLLTTPANIQKARRAVRKAMEIQRDRRGYAFVEFLSPCPTNLHLSPLDAAKFVDEEMAREFPPGCLRDRTDEAAARPAPPPLEPLTPADIEAVLDKCVAVPAPPGLDPDFGTIRIKMAGFGGQGVLSYGMMVAGAGLADGRHVSWFPSYGPEQRGGTANCSAVISGSAIGSPVLSHLQVLVAFNQPALDRFARDVEADGLILYDSCLAEKPTTTTARALGVPASRLAIEAGLPKAANTAMLAALACSGACRVASERFSDMLAQTFAGKPALVAANRRVFAAATEWCQANLRPE